VAWFGYAEFPGVQQALRYQNSQTDRSDIRLERVLQSSGTADDAPLMGLGGSRAPAQMFNYRKWRRTRVIGAAAYSAAELKLSQVRSYYYWQLVSRSVRLGLEPLIVTHGHILAWKKISVFSFVGRLPLSVDGTIMYRSQSLRVMCLFILLCACLSRFDIIIIIIIILQGSMYIPGLSVWALLAHYANGIYLRQFRHLNDRMPDRTFALSWVCMTSACFLHIFVM
jgi:hypothetical protein